MNIKVYKEYRFAFGKLVATDTGKEYTFSISRNDRFYHNMEKHITKEKVESLSYANIDDIYIEDKDSANTRFHCIRIFYRPYHIYVFQGKSTELSGKSNRSSCRLHDSGIWCLY